MGKIIISGASKSTMPIALPPIGTNLNDMSWKDIRKISNAGIAADYFSVGDTKTIILNGQLGNSSYGRTFSNYAIDVYILGINHNSEIEGENHIHFSIGKVKGYDIGIGTNYWASATNGGIGSNMNHWGNYNYGGWAGCDLRYDFLGSTNQPPSNYGSSPSSGRTGNNPTDTCTTNPVNNTLMSTLPEDLRSVMKSIIKYSNNVAGNSNVSSNVTSTIDYLPILSEFEVFGTRKYANQYEQNYQKQYAYYAAGNSKLKNFIFDEGTSVESISGGRCFLRSVPTDSLNKFLIISDSGTISSIDCKYFYIVGPIFAV